MEDFPAGQGAVAPQGAWAAVDHAPMTRTARSRLNSRPHQGRRDRTAISAGSPAPTAQPAPAMQPSFMQRNPLLAGIAGGIAGSWIGHMLFGATDSSAGPTKPVSMSARPTRPPGRPAPPGCSSSSCPGSRGALLFPESAATPAPDFSGITRSSAVSGSLLGRTFRHDPTDRDG